MSQSHEVQDLPKHVEAGRLLSERLRIAREMSGFIVCPDCGTHFDATHVIKCPECRTVIDETFGASSGKKATGRSRGRRSRQKARPRKTRRSQQVKEKVELELDFFSEGYMEYKG